MENTNSINWRIVLASKSPRRKELLKLLNIPFEVKTTEVDEGSFKHLKGEQRAEYLAQLKANALEKEIQPNDMIIACDTVVCIRDKTLGKPKDKLQAKQMLKSLSGHTHQVITGVCLKSRDKTVIFHANTQIVFKELSDKEINFYIENYKPFDKAGAYGIQEWIGAIGVVKIQGCYFNVVGLPLQLLCKKLASEFGFIIPKD